MDISVYRSKPDVVRVIKWKDRYWDDDTIFSRIVQFCNGVKFKKDDIKDGDFLVKDLSNNVTIINGKEFLKHYEYVAKLALPKMEQ